MRAGAGRKRKDSKCSCLVLQIRKQVHRGPEGSPSKLGIEVELECNYLGIFMSKHPMATFLDQDFS